MSANKQIAKLLIEGPNDRHVIKALCKQHHIDTEEIFAFKSSNGIEALMESISPHLKTPRLSTLGIVLDADQNIEARWHSVMNRLQEAGYADLPETPQADGTIIVDDEKPTVGIWVMPNNQLPGILENFIADLIPDGDELAAKAETILQEIEQARLNKYSSVKHPKAFIHTWLAWQKNPGQPMGLAITAHSLNHNAPLANSFIQWLQRLF